MENPVIIFGAGGLGKVALEIFESNQVVVYGFLDDDEKRHGQEINGISVLGNTDDDGFLKLLGKKCEAFIAVDEFSIREYLVEMLQKRRQVMPVNAFHRQAIVSENAVVGHGNLFDAGVLINTGTNVGNHCTFHSSSVIEYDVTIGDFVQIGAGSIIGANVKIGNGVFIGAGVTVVAGVNIGEDARIGVGSVVVENVPAKATVFGNPAKKI